MLVADIDRAAGQETAAKIQAEGGRAFAVAVDVSSAPDVEHMLRQVVDRFGGIDILYNNAGVNLYGKVADTEEPD